MWIIATVIDTLSEGLKIKVHTNGYESREKALDAMEKGIIGDGYRHAQNLRKNAYNSSVINCGGDRNFVNLREVIPL